MQNCTNSGGTTISWSRLGKMGHASFSLSQTMKGYSNCRSANSSTDFERLPAILIVFASVDGVFCTFLLYGRLSKKR